MIADKLQLLAELATAVGWAGILFGSLMQIVLLFRRDTPTDNEAFWQRFAIIMLLLVIAAK